MGVCKAAHAHAFIHNFTSEKVRVAAPACSQHKAMTALTKCTSHTHYHAARDRPDSGSMLADMAGKNRLRPGYYVTFALRQGSYDKLLICSRPDAIAKHCLQALPLYIVIPASVPTG